MVKKFLSILSIFCLFINQVLTVPLVFAQDLSAGEAGATPAATVESSASPATSPSSEPTPISSPQPQPSPSITPGPESSPSPSPQSSPSPESTVAPSPSPSPSPTPTPTPPPTPLWTENNGTYTTQILQSNTTYHFPPNEKVSLTFTKLPEGSGTVTVKEVNALGTTAYDITSNMADGTFEYILTLPTPTTKNVEVKASEDGKTFVTLGGVSPGDNILTITGLNHFTVFVVVGTISGSTATAFNNSANPDVLINEFMFNPSSGNDWVELYNQGQGDTGVSVDLTGWTLVDNTSTMITLSGTLPPGGFLAFDVSNRLNAASPGGDKIELRNADGIVDQVSYKDSTTIDGAQNVGNVDVGQSVGRMVDSGGVTTTWDIFPTPTKGSANPSIFYVSGDENYQCSMDVCLGTSNSPFQTIQEGIDAVAVGGTVNVTAGNDSDNFFINKDNITVSGSGSNTSIISNSSCFFDPVVTISNNGATVKGFTLDDGGACGLPVIQIDGGVSGVLIEENAIVNGGGILAYSALNNKAHRNAIVDNSVGIENQDMSNFFDATQNFWGDASGPFHEASNPNGQGNSVSDNVLFVPWYLTSDLTNLDSANPVITLNMPLPNMTLPSSLTVIASTNEAATCTYSLDGGVNSSMGITSGTSHTKDLSGLTAGSHNIRLSCTDLSGNSSTSSTVSWTVIDFNNIQSNVIFDSATAGQADLPNGITTLNLTNTTNFDVSAGLNSASGNNITIGGALKDLSNFTSGDLVGKNLSGIQSIGGVNFEIQKAVALQSGTNGQPILLTNTNLSGVNVSIPDGASVLAPNGWNGTIQPPKTGSSSGIAPSGFSIGSTVIEVGSALQVLLFDKPVEVILTGVTGSVGYKSAGSTTWTKITNTCGGTYAAPTAPTFPGECSISDGTNTKIVTYHFTSFAGLNTVSSSSSSTSDGGGGAGSSIGSNSVPTCNDTKPGSAPTFVSAAAGTNSVTLTWSGAADPVTYYLITYGEKSGAQTYGNPNVGGKGTTSYTVSGLSGGKKYYFKIRAGNGCMPGSYSGEISATPGGGTVSGIAPGFAAGVLGAKAKRITTPAGTEQIQGVQTAAPQDEQITAPAPSQQVAKSSNNGGFFGAIWRFILHLFGR